MLPSTVLSRWRLGALIPGGGPDGVTLPVGVLRPEGGPIGLIGGRPIAIGIGPGPGIRPSSCVGGDGPCQPIGLPACRGGPIGGVILPVWLCIIGGNPPPVGARGLAFGPAP